jgi:hypothetical protein
LDIGAKKERRVSFTFRLQRDKTNNKPYYNANKVSIYVQLWKPTKRNLFNFNK